MKEFQIKKVFGIAGQHLILQKYILEAFIEDDKDKMWCILQSLSDITPLKEWIESKIAVETS